MGVVTVLAQRSGDKNLWDPTILGVLVVLSAVGLFCGSVYLLLGTNLGARLGSSSPACSSGSWSCSRACGSRPRHHSTVRRGGRPVEGDRGRRRPEASNISAVHDIVDSGDPVDVEGLAQLRPATDGALVQKQAEGGVEPAPQEFRVRPLHRLSHRLRGLPDVHDRRGTKNLFWHNPAMRPSSSAPRSKSLRWRVKRHRRRVRPARRRSSRSSSTTADHCVSRHGCTSSRRSCCSGFPARAPLVREGRPRTQEERVVATRSHQLGVDDDRRTTAHRRGEDGGLAFLVFAIMVFLSPHRCSTWTASAAGEPQERRTATAVTLDAIQRIEPASAAASIVCSMSASCAPGSGRASRSRLALKYTPRSSSP